MENKKRPGQTPRKAPDQVLPAPQSMHKKTWQEPRLEFVEPKLTKRGKLTELTGFLGSFSP